MYCTGGIRCDIYSTLLKSRGFNNLYSLEGGVQVQDPWRRWHPLSFVWSLIRGCLDVSGMCHHPSSCPCF